MAELTPGCDDVTTNVPARTLGVACVAHALHDGYTDLTYVMLPVWQTGLSYVALAALRGLYVSALAGLQLPAGKLAERFGGRAILVFGTALAAVGYVLVCLAECLDFVSR